MENLDQKTIANANSSYFLLFVLPHPSGVWGGGDHLLTTK